jgi:hypothetical protein
LLRRLRRGNPFARDKLQLAYLEQSGRIEMFFSGHSANVKITLRRCWMTIALAAIGSCPSQARADGFDGPSFRKGMWHFVQTIELVLGRNTRQRLMTREATRCVDPTQAMKATFSTPSVGNCISAKPQRYDNRYTFSNRCDHMGPVSTVITVHSDESYTEVNELNVGLPRTELVVARRVGECLDGSQNSGGSPVLSH